MCVAALDPTSPSILLTVRNWNEARIGIVMLIGVIAGILAETPGSALIDAIGTKRTVVVLAARWLLLDRSCFLFYRLFWPWQFRRRLSVLWVRSSGRISQRSRLASLVMHTSPAAPTAMKLLITPVTPLAQRWLAAPLMSGDRASCSSPLRLWRWQALSA
jgi:hypothetical protein